MEETKMSEVVAEIKSATEEDLKKIIEQHFETVRIQGMKIGAGYISAAVYGAIEKNIKKGSLRDYQRAIKAVLDIVSVQLTQQNDYEENKFVEEKKDVKN